MGLRALAREFARSLAELTFLKGVQISSAALRERERERERKEAKVKSSKCLSLGLYLSRAKHLSSSHFIVRSSVRPNFRFPLIFIWSVDSDV